MNIRKILIVLNISLVAVLGFVLLKMFVFRDVPDATYGVNHISQPDKTQTPSVKEPRNPDTNYDGLLKRDLFAQNSADTDVQTQHIAAPVKVIAPDIELQGTIAGSDDIARAIIKDTKNNQTEVYRIGDEIGNAVIEQIQADRIVLKIQGQQLAVRINQKVSDAEATSKTGNPMVITSIPKSDRPLTRAQMRDQIIQEFLDKARITPVENQVGVQGLKINDIKQVKAAAFLGLEEDDVIQSVNGQKLNSKQKAFQVFKKAKTQPSITITLLRNDEPKELSFSMK